MFIENLPGKGAVCAASGPAKAYIVA